ncbi:MULTISPECIES: M14 family metallopeptidase [unclassified Tenacibaculum]|uniref:M14 family metallopeptidase n=1 Tax=unclassified Tenacibaculum TaxID=2635139 RepID=UPI001F487A80|nr:MULTISPECIES: M14 family metallopeptidase [unclassified Tenacibaculum]MCF2876346.1 M14 family metallopeptidase [Tenacibaculum sp. Cn5-1]MCF2936511.1 M14 family metallopeptidase [Tenacibaculum sp. Cn5-34]MCG7512764.1 M14 family metallopeptidase [Tenacibaculum sp. Cn5-46]
MKKLYFIFLLSFLACKQNSTKAAKDFTTLFEKSNGTETPEYKEVISFYEDLANTYNEISLFEIGKTDSGNPLHLAVFNANGKTDLTKIKDSSKNRILINNGIHPGESDGIDASMLLLRDIIQNDSLKKAYANSLICVIPVYNIGGALNRNSHTRANQNGPKEYGFRGNARNYDLNRDFIKQDTKNAAAFAEIFHIVSPDIFIDNHVSNGADYQYAITHLFTQHNKLGGKLGHFLENEMRPYIEKSLAQKEVSITPYVNVWGSTPDKGWSQFFDSPRYSTGYTTLFNTLGLMVETHMLKPYKIRVNQTYDLLFSSLDFSEKYSSEIKDLRNKAFEEVMSQKTYPISFKVDKTNPSEFKFMGYEGTYIDSEVTNGKRLFYDRTKPYTKNIPYYNNFLATKEVKIPEAYILQQGWHKIIDRLTINKIEFTRFKNDTTLIAEIQHITDFESRKQPYEGHYLHYNTQTRKTLKPVMFKKGDLYIPTKQKGIRYLIETLEAEATDSFFNWNFFDTILQQKEGFSAYVFEDIAAEYLKNNPEFKQKFEEKLSTDKEFSKSAYAQLLYIYKATPHYEKSHMMLPIFKKY